MAQKFRHEAREWLKDDVQNIKWICYSGNRFTIVEALYRAGAVKVEVGGLEEFSNEADTLYVTLPEDRDATIKVMVLLTKQHGDEVDLVDGETDVVHIWWN